MNIYIVYFTLDGFLRMLRFCFSFVWCLTNILCKIQKEKEFQSFFVNLNKISNENFIFFRILLSVRFFFMELNIGHIVWARHTKDNIYWPGKITMISNNTNDLWSNELFDNNFQQQSTYLVQFFITNQSYWTNDIFPYYQYREYMTNPSFIQYGLHPMIKDNFLNAIYQADYACNDQSNANNSSDTSTTTYRSTQENQEQTFLSIFEENTDNNTLLMSRSEIVSNNGK